MLGWSCATTFFQDDEGGLVVVVAGSEGGPDLLPRTFSHLVTHLDLLLLFCLVYYGLRITVTI